MYDPFSRSCFAQQPAMIRLLLSIALVLATTAVSNAAVISFQPGPASAEPEIIYAPAVPGAGPGIMWGPGSRANGDGHLPPEQQTPGGLTVEVPFVVPGIPTGTVNPASGTTTFRDVTLAFSGLNRSGAPISNHLVTIQELHGGTIGLGLSTLGVFLYGGSFRDAVLVLDSSGTTGSILSDTVTFGSGALAPYFGSGVRGSFSISLANITFTSTAPEGVIPNFTADATGQFNIIPEPAGALSIVAPLLLLARRRRLTARPFSV